MKAIWGRKVSDLGFGQFMSILEWVAVKRGKRVVKIDRWYASTQLCHVCQHRNTHLETSNQVQTLTTVLLD
jgi:putative transposase